VAVAGAIALQMLFSGVETEYTKTTGQDTSRANLQIEMAYGDQVTALGEKLDRTEGVRNAMVVSRGWVGEKRSEPELTSDVTVGDCAALREMAKLPTCRDGDVFVVQHPDDTDSAKLAEPGRTLYFDPTYPPDDRGKEIAWTVPGSVKNAEERKDSLRGDGMWGLLVTPSALSDDVAPALMSVAYVRLDPSMPDAADHVRNTAAAIDPLADVWKWSSTETSTQYASIRTGLFVGAACVLLLIGASLLVSQLEQLRERKKLLSALVAFGTRRRTLSLSVLWQTAIPIALGLVLSSVVGLTLGAVLLRMTAVPVTVDWASVLSMAGVGAGVVVLVTLLSLPPLLRLMRPDGLRTE
jgi:hypothetical protein